MKVFISGTDTDVGKTLISSWMALHTGFAYFKPIQTGTKEGSDSREVQKWTKVKIYPETYSYLEPVSPHLAARLENDRIDIDKIRLPQESQLIIEGAGGVLVPLNEKHLMIDLIKKLKAPVLLVVRTGLGTINHTLLSLQALRSRAIRVLGVIMNGEPNAENKKAIEFYGSTDVLAEFPKLHMVTQGALEKTAFPKKLKELLTGKFYDSF